MYRVARTEIPGQSFRPFDERLGYYRPASFPIPTQSYRRLPTPGPVTGGLGADSGISMPTLLLLVGAGVGAWWFWGRG